MSTITITLPERLKNLVVVAGEKKPYRATILHLAVNDLIKEGCLTEFSEADNFYKELRVIALKTFKGEVLIYKHNDKKIGIITGEGNDSLVALCLLGFEWDCDTIICAINLADAFCQFFKNKLEIKIGIKTTIINVGRDYNENVINEKQEEIKKAIKGTLEENPSNDDPRKE